MSLIGLGKAHYEVESYDQSIELFKNALKIDKNSDEALTGLGLSYTKLGNYNLAMDYFNRAVKVSDENVDAKYGIAYLYYSMDKIDRDKEHFLLLLIEVPELSRNIQMSFEHALIGIDVQ